MRDRARTVLSEPLGYDGDAWSTGPQRVYDRLAERAVGLLATDLRDRSALDAGAGTGALTRALLARGAQVDAADTSADMLAQLRRQTPAVGMTTVADIRALPIADASYDVSVAGFVLNHLRDPEVALLELSRVTRTGGQVVATTFGVNDPPAKRVVERVLSTHGWSPPDWYVALKEHAFPLTETVSAFTAVAHKAGLNARVDAATVDFGDLDAGALAAWRLGMAPVTPFLSTLSEPQRRALTEEAVDAVRSTPPLQLPMLVLVAGVPA
ncbi:MAG: class I SAM-dependent methyltransferase [Actinomycetes bacterium]